jgi:hypothetical protein
MKMLLTAGAVMFAWTVVTGGGTSLAATLSTLPSQSPASYVDAIQSTDEAINQVQASIVDRAGDEFIARTEAGDEFRLPVEGAPPDTEIGDALTLVPNPDTQTIEVFKTDPRDGAADENPQSQL